MLKAVLSETKLSAGNILYISLAVIILSVSCKKDNPSSNMSPPIPWDGCVSVTDAETGLPLQHVSIEWLWGCCCNEWKMTDSLGKACDFHSQYGACHESSFTKSGYIVFTHPFLPHEVELQKSSYLRLHIKNIAPADPSDTMVVSVPKGYGYLRQYYLKGATIDTIIFQESDSRYDSLRCSLNGFQYGINYNLNTSDTLDVDVFY